MQPMINTMTKEHTADNYHRQEEATTKQIPKKNNKCVLNKNKCVLNTTCVHKCHRFFLSGVEHFKCVQGFVPKICAKL